MSSSSLEVYIEEPPLRKRLDRLARCAMYAATAMWAVIAIMFPVANITAIHHGPGCDMLISLLLGLSSAVAALAALHGKRIIELAASPFVTVGILPFFLGALIDNDWALACATGSLIFANLARGNTLRTAVRRATTIKELTDKNVRSTN